MVNTTRALCGVVFFLFAFFRAGAQQFQFKNAPPFALISVREMGYGGQHAAYNNDIFLVFNNPAALSMVQQSSVAGISVGLSILPADMNDVFSVLSGKPPDAERLAPLADKRITTMPAGAQLAGPALFGITRKSCAFGVFNRSQIISSMQYLKTTNDPQHDTVVYSANIVNDIILAGSGALNILNTPLHKIDAGGGVQLLFRNVIKTTGTQFLSAVRKDLFTLDPGSGEPRNLLGTAFNAGILYRGFERFSAGITASNIPGGALSITSEAESDERGFLFVPQLNIGAAYKFLYSHQIMGTVMFDLRDIVAAIILMNHVPAGAILSASAGIEMIFLNKWILSVGCAGLQPSAGVGCDWGSVKLYAAVCGKEYGLRPGTQSGYSLNAGIHFMLE